MQTGFRTYGFALCRCKAYDVQEQTGLLSKIKNGKRSWPLFSRISCFSEPICHWARENLLLASFSSCFRSSPDFDISTDGRTYIQAYVHTYIHTRIHAHIHTYTQRPQTQIPKSSALDPIPKTLLESPKAEVRVRAKTSPRFQENSATPSPGAFDFVQEAFIYTIGSSKGSV